ncbi:hypothetical protein DPEC_G00024520 [Dallia pectoralis]|uniref:Uncharacterized protein n=1 Tax=Dallia pectoralis TaxID=75939 RepID=A0ACC2HH08_DALPE|nr:hypothetical protein DPEC_G00024520 [Dallia pectoralis]
MLTPVSASRSSRDWRTGGHIQAVHLGEVECTGGLQSEQTMKPSENDEPTMISHSSSDSDIELIQSLPSGLGVQP